MKIVVQVIVLTMLSFSTMAQFTIHCVVKDKKTNAALAGATVKIAERVYVTGENGVAEIPALPSGHYDVEVKFLGYETHTFNVTLLQDELLEVKLTEAFTLTDEVIIYATRANDKTPLTYTNISKESLQKQNFGQDLPILLNWTPSVVTTSDAGAGVGYTGIRIRGSDATRINVTINGIPYNDSESMGTFWVNIPDIASSSQSIQVQRGVGTSTNGASAFGATINMQTTGLNREAYAAVSNSFGSFNTRKHTLNAGTGLINNHWVVDARLSRIASDGFIDRAFSDLQSYYLSAGYHSDKTILKAVVFGGGERTYQSWYGVPQSRLNKDEEAMEITAMNEGWNDEQLALLKNSNSRTFNIYTYKNQVDNYKQDHYQLHFSRQLTTSLTANASVHYTYGRGYYEEFRIKDEFENYGLEDVTIGDSVITAADIIRRRWLDNDFYGFTYSFQYDKDKLSTVLGGGWNRYEGDHFGEIIWAEVTTVPAEYRYYFNVGDKQDFNIYAKTNYQLTSRLNAYVDMQYRKINYTASGKENRQNDFDLDVAYNFFNPKIGLLYDVSSREQVYASFARANREPVRDDFVDNPGNSPRYETLNNLEAGYRITTDMLALQVNYYLMSYDNQLVLTGKINDVGAAVRTNVADSYRTGIEAEATLKISEKLVWGANVTVSKNKIRNFTEVLYDYGVNFDEFNVIERSYKNSNISFSPAVIAGSTFTWMPFQRAEVTLLSKYIGRQYLDNTSNKNRSIDPYFINDIRLAYSFVTKESTQFSVSFLLNNVFDELYESNGYTYGYLGGGAEYRENYYYPQAGRNVMAMLTMKF